MPKNTSPRLTEEIYRFVLESSDGINIEAIVENFRSAASKRTLQRRLTDLVKSGRVSIAGRGRAVRYRASHIPTGMPSIEEGASIPLSPVAAELRNRITRRETDRQPVGYRPEFLDQYRPNETRYLAPEVIEHLHRIGQVPGMGHIAGTYARSVLSRLLIDLSWASSKLEGNTYSLLETERLLELGEAAHGKAALETQMILNHKDAIEFLVDGAQQEEVGINAYTIKSLHALLANNLLPDPGAGGRLRTIAVGIGGSVYVPLNGGTILADAFDQLIATAVVIREPFEQAFFLLAQLLYLQPFDDVNKRVSRLAANIPFIKHNLCPLSFIDVPERPYIDGLLTVYELNRVELLRDVFIWAYERSAQRYVAVRQSIGEPDQFRLRYREAISFVVRGFVQRKMQPTPQQVRSAAEGQSVAPEHLDHFVRVVQQELLSLHEGNYARYRLRPSEFEAWRRARSSA